jgi:hypothetical protein
LGVGVACCMLGDGAQSREGWQVIVIIRDGRIILVGVDALAAVLTARPMPRAIPGFVGLEADECAACSDAKQAFRLSLCLMPDPPHPLTPAIDCSSIPSAKHPDIFISTQSRLHIAAISRPLSADQRFTDAPVAHDLPFRYALQSAIPDLAWSVMSGRRRSAAEERCRF